MVIFIQSIRSKGCFPPHHAAATIIVIAHRPPISQRTPERFWGAADTDEDVEPGVSGSVVLVFCVTDSV